MRRSEIAFALVAAILIAFFGFADRIFPRAEVDEAPAGAGRFLSSGWYCPVPTGEGFNSQVATTNLGEEPVRVRRWSIAGSQRSSYHADEVAPRRRSTVAVSDLGLPDAAAVVEVFGAQSTSDSMTIADNVGLTASRCSVQPSDRWYFSVASTARGLDTFLLVANPFAEEAVLRIRIITADRDVVPARLSDHVIPPLSQTPIFLAEFFEETESFGLEVQATQGRVVVARHTRVAARDGRRGMFSDVGIREPSPRWFFAGGEVPAEGDEFAVITNPGERESLVQFIIQTETEQLSPPELAELPIPAGRQVVVRLADFLPRGFIHGMTISSVNAVPIVAERLIYFGGAVRGADSSFGSPALGTRFVTSVGTPIGGIERLAIVNHSTSQAVIRIVLITADGETVPPGLEAVQVGAGRRATVDVTPFLGGGMATAVIEALSGEIVVERIVSLGGSVNDFSTQAAQPLE